MPLLPIIIKFGFDKIYRNNALVLVFLFFLAHLSILRTGEPEFV